MATFEWPLDKLGIINSGLSQTGDNTVTAANDGSDEWNTASPAYERALAYMMESHGWYQATAVRTMTPSPTAPADTYFDTAFDLPDDLVHLIWVRVNDLPTVWGFLDNQLVVNAQGGPPPPVDPSTPAVVKIKGVFSTNGDPVYSTPTFVLALQAFVMSGIYRGLHEDVAQAERMWMAGKALLQDAMTRQDQQGPKRSMFNSRISASRRIRRPWPPVPSGWGGTGSPG
ncbi:hypothetical protein IVB43_23865 [Bradyrhizobium sp. 48]|uniref:hypothetical protein n=1 Tax=Bradyrhizobium sp. 48 TaxID=2782676 RepID=UPI001FF9C55D|nr:hypothetical protein [Bradyrhizobium sp. 48]MCK1445426.1 hypothetical protein [Bradyrhizobium sp. 48]